MKVQRQSKFFLSKTHDISISTLCNIKNNRDHNIGEVFRRKFEETDKSNEIVIDKLLIDFIKAWRKPFVISELCRSIKLKSNIDIPYHIVHEFVKNKL